MKESKERKYDLEERTAQFAEEIIRFCKKLPRDEITRPIITQMIKSCTSIGANYCEADNAESRKDFKHKISICKKEAKESKYWLRIIETACPDYKDDIKPLWQEAKELTLIFNAIVNTTEKNSIN